jgi:SAM-dependent methyltransferase
MNSWSSHEIAYAGRLDAERAHYDRVEIFDDLPAIYHYWSHTFVRPMLEAIGCSRPADFFARYLTLGAQRSGADRPVFLSIGSGDANNEIEIARLLKAAQLGAFTIECLEMNPSLIERSQIAAREAGLGEHLVFAQQDFNSWQPARSYQGVIANQSLHHVTNLEGLFDAVRRALAPEAYFVTSDIIGRNGHQRWPEARRLVDRFWLELPASYRTHRQLGRYEEFFEDWDCSSEGFEGIRSQDVLPLLLERFVFHAYIGFGNVVDPFVDRGFGPNFNASAQWDRSFIDRVHACDERAMLAGYVTPTHIIAALSTQPCVDPFYARGLTPQASVRSPEKIVGVDQMDRADRDLTEFFSVSDRRLPLRGAVRQIGGVRGWHEDDWVGDVLEFSVVPERPISRMSVQVTIPPGMPDDATLAVDVNGLRVGSAAAHTGAVMYCSVSLAAGKLAEIRVSTTATLNLYERGLSEDARDLGFHLDAVLFET